MTATTDGSAGPLYDEKPVMFGANPVGFILLLAIAPVGAICLTSLIDATLTIEGLGPFSYYDLWILCVTGPVLFVLVSLGAWWLGNVSNRLIIEDDRVRYRRGLLSKNVRDISIPKIRTVEIYQTPFQRLTNVGRVRIFGTGDLPEIVVSGLPRPDDIKSLLNTETL